ncbi:CCA tRNA nucleotidyltransferase [Rhodomicrobium sp.]|uniref:CCA tRNA nucleotidyltransferase n=1 Tax=Rhodomicrobium sp. TaxID=2720632 RepID=UPI0039E3A561
MTKLENVTVADAAWFRAPEVRAVFACLNREGFEVRAVGGAVRNALLDEPVMDVDFATTAKPDDTLRLAAAAGIKTVPTGIDHGTITLVVDGVPFEVTTLRRDVDTDGRRATVAFADNWAEDARRRDFTLNALYADAAGAVYDPLDGLPDLLARRVRFVGDADTRIREDYLRILRFFRFSADYANGDFDADGVAAAIRERHGLRRLSAERVRAEMLRILVTVRAPDAIRVMDESGLLLIVLGGIARRSRFERIAAIEAELEMMPDPMYRLAALSIFVEEDAERLAGRLRLSNDERNDLMGLASVAPWFRAPLGKRDLETLLYRIGARTYLGSVLIGWAASGAPLDDGAWRFAAELPREWQRPKFPVNGADLLNEGWLPGPGLGAHLRYLEERFIASGFTLDREALLALEERNARPNGVAGSKPGT